ncbi:MAG: VTT domain-containing protein [Desulfobulbaceae bacterium]|nr:VTT domain-containing protein [Desulfobulbaceae bacterium]
MEQSISDLFQALDGNTFLQGLLIVFSTFILEDPTTIGSGLLVVDGKIAYATAFSALAFGIAAGDLGLYWLGRFMQKGVMSLGMVNEKKLHKAQSWFNHNIILAVASSRFLPGMRLPTYIAAGMLRVSVWKFLSCAIAASIVWTLFLLQLTVMVGEAAFDVLGRWKWPVGLGVVMLIAFSQWRLGRTVEAKKHDEAQVSFFEFWPPALFYFPVALYCLFLALRHRSIMLPTAANPGIYSGGMIMESKSAILSLVDQAHQHYVAPWLLFSMPQNEAGLAQTVKPALDALGETGLSFPLVAKPDTGQRGAGVQPIHDEKQLASYLHFYQPESEIILQKLVDYQHEAGVFYYRRPEEEAGRIFSITLKRFPEVIGDGESRLRELILADARARKIRKVYFKRHKANLDRILKKGERYRLVFAGNHCQGAIFKDGSHLATPELLRTINAIAVNMPGFYFGRFDLRFKSMQTFREGRELQIIEINGASAEATHIWDGRTSLLQAYQTLFAQFAILFEIGAANRKNGTRLLPAGQFARDMYQYRRRAQKYPPAL